MRREILDAMARLEILDAMAEAIDHRQEVLTIASGAADLDQAREALRAAFGWSPAQAQAALDLQIARFNVQMRERIEKERASMRSIIDTA